MIRKIVDDPVIRCLAILFLITRLALLAAGLVGTVWAGDRPVPLRLWVDIGGGGAAVAMACFAAGWWVG